MQYGTLPENLQRMVENELEEGETLQWAGQPNPGRFMLATILPALMGIFVTGFAIFWMTMAFWITGHGSGGGPPGVFSCFPLFGLIFVFVGIGMMCSPLWARHRASNTAYAVTNRRAIIFDGGWSTSVRSFNPSMLGHLERRQRGDGSGDIILAREMRYRSGHYTGGTAGRGGHYTPGGYYTHEIGFFGIPDVKEVHGLLQDLAAQKTGDARWQRDEDRDRARDRGTPYGDEDKERYRGSEGRWGRGQG